MASECGCALVKSSGAVERPISATCEGNRARPVHEPPGADPHAGWCGEGRLKAGLYPIGRRRSNADVFTKEKLQFGKTTEVGVSFGRGAAFRDVQGVRLPANECHEGLFSKKFAIEFVRLF